LSREYKQRVISKYLTGRTGIPSLFYNKTIREIESPPPYKFYVSTDYSFGRFFSYLKSMPEGSLSFTIRYDKGTDGVDNAIVGMTMDTFAQLLKTHYDNIQDRVTTYEEERNN
jgi:hypothetical protein|tara:strand:+ start:748 stop:1086 length:339 start_codon:yes stop_codon:yes gene_type:complete